MRQWISSIFGFTSDKKVKSGEDYERLLTDLDRKIKLLEVQLVENRLAERSFALKFIGGSIISYLGMLFYVFILTSQPSIRHLLLVITFPIGCFYVKQVFGWFFSRKIFSLEEELQALRGKQKLKLEELKQKSDYYRTIKLIERFDSSATKKTPIKSEKIPVTNISNPQLPSNSHQQKTNSNEQQPVSNNTNSSAVLPRGWLDRWTDYLLGEEDARLRYALICSKCYAHNGLTLLVPLNPFRCKNCHYLNNSPEENNNTNNLDKNGGIGDGTPLVILKNRKDEEKLAGKDDSAATPLVQNVTKRKVSK